MKELKLTIPKSQIMRTSRFLFSALLTVVLSSDFSSTTATAQPANPQSDTSIENTDYVSNRNDPSIEDLLSERQAHHPAEVQTHEHQVSESLTIAIKDKTIKKDQDTNLTPLQLNRSSVHCETIAPTNYSVCGAILDKYKQIGAQLSWLGPPKSNELTNPDGQGKRTEFYGGSIYWHPDTGAHPVTPKTMEQWATLGWEQGILGYPISGPIDTRIPLTQQQNFQKGDIYSSPISAGAVWGDIRKRYNEMGGSNHPIGVPISNELQSGNQFRYTNFSNGTISWKNDRKTRFMYLATQRVWEALGRESGSLGWPTSDEQPYITGQAHHVDFGNRGIILWGAGIGARELNGEAFTLWKMLGGINGFGTPKISHIPFSESEIQGFQNGAIWGTNGGLAYLGGRKVSDSLRSTPRQRSDEHTLPNNASGLPDKIPSRPLHLARDTHRPADIIYPKFRIFGNPDYIIRRGYYSPDNVPGVGFGWDKVNHKHGINRMDMLEEAFEHYKSRYFEPSEKGAEGYETDIFFVACNTESCNEFAKPVLLRQIYLSESRTTFKNVPSKMNENDDADLGLVNAFCAQNDGNPFNLCPQRMRSTKKFGWVF